jgi:hypothetical protein
MYNLVNRNSHSTYQNQQPFSVFGLFQSIGKLQMEGKLKSKYNLETLGSLQEQI